MATGTYRLHNPTVTIETTDGTKKTVQCDATSLALEAENNTVEHPRTGCTQPYNVPIDASYTLTLGYAHNYGTDGVFRIIDELKGTLTKWYLQTNADEITAEFPLFEFDAYVPFPSPLPSTDMGEFASGELEVAAAGDVTTHDTAPNPLVAKGGKK